MARLEVEGLSFSYPGADVPTLQNVAFSVEPGGSLALLGSSGAGKTTLLNLLSGLLPCETGRIVFGGVDLAPLGAGKRGVAQVFQFPVLYDSLSVRDNIAFPLRTRGVGRRERSARAESIGELFDLRDVLSQKPAELSLFQKQLAGFAKALVRDDLSMVLLDEPLTAVEPAMKWRLRGAVKSAQEELGVTMVYVTHDQTEALTFADTVSVLHGGKLLQTATPADLYATPAHSEVARFIGNPGMNLLPIEATDRDFGSDAVDTQFPDELLAPVARTEVGFRPEWASLNPARAATAAMTLSGVVVRQQLTGASADRELGITTVAIASDAAESAFEVQVISELGHEPGATVELFVHKYQVFRGGWRIDVS